MHKSTLDLIFGTLAICVALGVPLIGIIGGRINEYRHLRKLNQREAQNCDFIVTQLKSFPALQTGESPPKILFAETVIASDYLKTFLASIRGIWGGEVSSYQRMLDRARRETLLRLIDSAREQGFNAICNVRLETADVGGGTTTRGKKAIPMAAILGSATGYQASHRSH